MCTLCSQLLLEFESLKNKLVCKTLMPIFCLDSEKCFRKHRLPMYKTAGVKFCDLCFVLNGLGGTLAVSLIGINRLRFVYTHFKLCDQSHDKISFHFLLHISYHAKFCHEYKK